MKVLPSVESCCSLEGCVCVFSPAFRGAFVALWRIFRFEHTKLGFRVYVEKFHLRASDFLSSMWKPYLLPIPGTCSNF